MFQAFDPLRGKIINYLDVSANCQDGPVHKIIKLNINSREYTTSSPQGYFHEYFEQYWKYIDVNAFTMLPDDKGAVIIYKYGTNEVGDFMYAFGEGAMYVIKFVGGSLAAGVEFTIDKYAMGAKESLFV